jgi:hypothetical protein
MPAGVMQPLYALLCAQFVRVAGEEGKDLGSEAVFIQVAERLLAIEPPPVAAPRHS